MSAGPAHVHESQVPWTANPTYPPEVQAVYRYKELIGGPEADWPGVPQLDVRMGVVELAPGARYPFHAHPAPEIYYVAAGQARWSINTETFDAPAGTAIRHHPHDRHAMENVGAEVLRLVYFWWAPHGQAEVLQVRARLVEAEGPSASAAPDGAA